MTGKALIVAAFALALLGCGSGEDPAASAPADPSSAVSKSGPVTKPSSQALDGGSAEAVAKEEHGG